MESTGTLGATGFISISVYLVLSMFSCTARKGEEEGEKGSINADACVPVEELNGDGTGTTTLLLSSLFGGL